MELHTFCDASNEAIGAVSYLKSVQDDRQVQVSFALGKAKLAPTHATTTPCLELCAAILGVEVAELVIKELDLKPQPITYYSDSRVVLRYISNEIRWFYVYVSNRVQRIRRSTFPNNWHYIPSHLNPADLATRSVDAQNLSESTWHTGPMFLHNKHMAADMPTSSLASETKQDDPEVRPEIKALTTQLLVRYYHARVQHQGRHITLGAIRSHGLWILSGKCLINSVINKCIKCQKLRGRHQIQKMSDLPVDQLTPAPPSSYVGLDVFGPWLVSTRRTRGGVANSKCWALLFTCLGTRAIHIELVESMDSSSFINALRWFLAFWGPVVQLCPDCGTNFVGAYNEFQASLNEMDHNVIKSYLAMEGCDWIFNARHSSHASGVWEWMIGGTRRILDTMLADIGPKRLSHEVL